MTAADSRLRSSDLFDYALIRPMVSAEAPDTLKIVSGYASCAMAVAHFLAVAKTAKSMKRRLPLNVDLVYGMTGAEGLTKPNHLGFVSMANHSEFSYDGDFECSYVKRPEAVHSKVYVWCRGGEPVAAFTGSANYSQQAFYAANRTETLTGCDPESALDFFNAVKARTVSCLSARWDEFSPRAKAAAKAADSAIGVENDIASPFFGKPKAEISLLNKNGDMGNGGCLNWGVRPDGTPRTSGASRREPNQAYIRVPGEVRKSDFFPKRPYRFTVTTDDDQVLSCVRAQDGDKAIETPQNNSELGRYFRRRLGLPLGSYITVEDMRRYGRMSVTFYKLAEDSFYMDFSRPGGRPRV